MSSRLLYVDYIKAIGIILVVIGHVYRGLRFDLYVPNYQLLKVLDSVIYTFHMPLFFFISGLFFYNAFIKKGWFGFILSKVDTVVYPYIIWRFIDGLPMVILASYGIVHQHMTYSSLLRIWHPITQFWFLYDLFLFFVVSALIYIYLPKKYTFFLFLISITLYFFQLEIKSQHWFLLGNFAKNYVYFVLGILLSNKMLKLKPSSTGLLVIIGILFFCLQYHFHSILSLSWEDKGPYTLIIGFVSILFVSLLSIMLSKHYSDLFKLIGSQSIAIYVMHVIFIAISRVILIKFLHIEEFYINFVSGVLLGLFMPILIVKICEKLGFPYLVSFPFSQLFAIRK